MSDAWRLHIREAVVRRQGDTKIRDVIPHDEDLELVYRIAIWFNIQSFWSQCIRKNCLVECNEEMGYRNHGTMLLWKEVDMGRRKSILSRINSKCRCVSTNPAICCNTSRCSCRKQNKKCDDRWKCPGTACSNEMSNRTILELPPSVNHVEKQLIERKKGVSGRMNIQSLLAMSTGAPWDETSGKSENEDDEESEVGVASDVLDWASQSSLDSLQNVLEFDEDEELCNRDELQVILCGGALCVTHMSLFPSLKATRNNFY